MQHLNLSFRSSWNRIFQFWEEITAPSCAGSVRPVNAWPSELWGRVGWGGICPLPYFGQARSNLVLLMPPSWFSELPTVLQFNACTYPDHKIYFNDKIVPSHIRFQSGIEFQILKNLNFINKRQLNLIMYSSNDITVCELFNLHIPNCEKLRDSWVEDGTKLKIPLEI